MAVGFRGLGVSGLRFGMKSLGSRACGLAARTPHRSSLWFRGLRVSAGVFPAQT